MQIVYVTLSLQILFQAESQIVSSFSKQHRQLICTNMKIVSKIGIGDTSFLFEFRFIKVLSNFESKNLREKIISNSILLKKIC